MAAKKHAADVYDHESENVQLQQNDESIDLLSNHVSRIKELSLQIGRDAEDDVKFLDRAQDTISRAGDILSASFQKLDNLLFRTATRRQLCYIILGFFLFFLFLYFFVLRRSTTPDTAAAPRE